MSDSTDATMKSVKVPTFNGKTEAFQTWWTRFKAFANAYGFLPALSAKAQKDLPKTDNKAEIIFDQRAAVKRNIMALPSQLHNLRSDGVLSQGDIRRTSQLSGFIPIDKLCLKSGIYHLPLY
jgi:hypothetical protein